MQRVSSPVFAINSVSSGQLSARAIARTQVYVLTASLSQRLRQSGNFKLAAILDDCSKFELLLQDGTTYRVPCRSRACRRCVAARATRLGQRWASRLAGVEGRFGLATLTMRTLPVALGEAIDVAQGLWRNATNDSSIRSAFKNKIVGGFRGLHWHRTAHGYHVHFHVLIHTLGDIADAGQWLIQRWRNACKLAHIYTSSKAQDCKELRGDTFKTLVYSAGYAADKKAIDGSARSLSLDLAASKGRRQCNPFGAWHGASRHWLRPAIAANIARQPLSVKACKPLDLGLKYLSRRPPRRFLGVDTPVFTLDLSFDAAFKAHVLERGCDSDWQSAYVVPVPVPQACGFAQH